MGSSNSAAESRTLRRAGWPLGWGLLGAVVLLLSWLAGSLHRVDLLDELEGNARQELDLYISHLNGQFERFAYLPPLLADDFRLHSLLIAPGNREQQDQVNQFLEHVNAIAGSLDVYLMDRQGNTLAASNWRKPLTFVGRNFAFRPYFVEAMRGRAGRYYALGTTSGRRGFYFSYPVGDRDEPLGVVVVKIDIDTLENDWRNEGSELIITDPDGIIFVATRPEWRYRGILPLSADTMARIRASRRYPDDRLAPIRYRQEQLASGAQLVRLGGPGGAGFISVASYMPLADWQVRLLVSQKVIAPQLWQTRLLALTLMILGATGGWLYAARRRRQRELETERRAAMQEALDELERRVDRRTLDLTEANRLLRHEVEGHERTRDELIQAAKLAALGQMSAGINHELNQPLAAMRTYSDNARAYLERENLEQVAWNLQQISELTSRMAQISGQLKVFSRKSSGQRIRVSLRACLDGAMRILRTRVSEVGAQLQIDMPDADLSVAADMVQLEQVLVNLIGNACNALLDVDERRIDVTARRDGERVRVQVRDSGQGIGADDLAHIFDPFFTTSDSGLGLGLSISHTIAQRLGGSLTAGNADGGGAVFTLTLVAWDDE